jgi:hypothetical protein
VSERRRRIGRWTIFDDFLVARSSMSPAGDGPGDLRASGSRPPSSGRLESIGVLLVLDVGVGLGVERLAELAAVAVERVGLQAQLPAQAVARP